jgi:hypothetical protein
MLHEVVGRHDPNSLPCQIRAVCVVEKAIGPGVFALVSRTKNVITIAHMGPTIRPSHHSLIIGLTAFSSALRPFRLPSHSRLMAIAQSCAIDTEKDEGR